MLSSSSSAEITAAAAHLDDLEPPLPTITRNHHLRGGKKMDSDFQTITSRQTRPPKQRSLWDYHKQHCQKRQIERMRWCGHPSRCEHWNSTLPSQLVTTTVRGQNWLKV
ncbi:hypothetical protein C1H46_032836 [Malus baccata]|uniref:Uncharacterized protein n=1 Tax=Malus baccata TaxID=106549 RepID=A0A540L546_MALBA|nr:hypothetical protein C1H46_032836 [Malus baccata]